MRLPLLRRVADMPIAALPAHSSAAAAARPPTGFQGYACTSRRVEGAGVLVHTDWPCERDGAVVTWKRF